MAVIKAVHSRASIGRAVTYVTKEEKTEDKLITGKDCDPFRVIEDMNATKELWGKTGGRTYDHYVQSFHENEQVTPQKAHEIACKWAEKEFKGHECLISTHVDKGHIHSHFIVNTVNFEDGKKLHTSAHWLDQAKAHSDELCHAYGLTITQKGKTFDGLDREDMTSWNKNKYNLLEKADQGKAKSYVYDTALAVMDSKESAISRADFISKMAEKGYQTEWTDRKKHITFTDQEGNKVRASNLEKTFKIPFGKEQLEHEFEQNAQRTEPQRTTETQRTAEPQYTAEEWELYRTLHAIADRQSRAEQAYTAVSERFAERGYNDSTSGIRPRAEERSLDVQPTGTRTLKPSETVRSLTERVQKYSIEARADFRERLQNLVGERRKSKSKYSETVARLDEAKSRGTATEQRIAELSTQRSRTADGIREINERLTRNQSRGMER